MSIVPVKIKGHKVLDNLTNLPTGPVQKITAGHRSFCLTHHKGEFGRLDNKCLHQGDPLGEGSID